MGGLTVATITSSTPEGVANGYVVYTVATFSSAKAGSYYIEVDEPGGQEFETKHGTFTLQ